MRFLRPIAICVFLAFSASADAAQTNPQIKVATFAVDATPSVGSMMAYDVVVRHDELPLSCRGIAILGADKPIVLCAVDWIGIANESQDAFKTALAKAAGTVPERVAVHTLHQHDAPDCNFTAEKLLKEAGAKELGRFDGTFARTVIDRAASALNAAVADAQPVTHYGWGEAVVKEVASNRRIKGPDGKVRVTRYTATKDEKVRAEPEGVIDPVVSLLSFWNGNKPVAVLSYYASHPQSYYRTGIPGPDFPGIARFIRGQAVPEALHVHFNGAGGNIGAGKYNDGARTNRVNLALKLADGMARAWINTVKSPLKEGDIRWKFAPVSLPPARHLDEARLKADLFKTSVPLLSGRAADKLAWLQRCRSGHKVNINMLSVGTARVLHMPGELFVEYQLEAKRIGTGLNVSMAAYGDYGPGYIGTERAYLEGGYETSEGASDVAPEVEGVLRSALLDLLEQR